MTKKSIAALTVLALTSLFSLTQVTNASTEQGVLNVQSMEKNLDTLRQEIKETKEQLKQKFLKNSDPATAEIDMDSLERELPYIINSHRSRPSEENEENFPKHNLEDKLTDTKELTDLLNQYKKFLSGQQYH